MSYLECSGTIWNVFFYKILLSTLQTSAHHNLDGSVLEAGGKKIMQAWNGGLV